LKWAIETLVQYAQGACEELKERTDALWKVTGDYLWPTNPGAWGTATEAAEEETVTAKEEG
jgi:hypothetical protein